MQGGTKMNKKMPKWSIIVFCLLCIFIFSVGGVLAKYITSYQKLVNVQSREFYFESDYLLEDGAVYSLNPGTTSVTFSLKNHPDTLRYSADNIAYEVTYTGDSGATFDPKSSGIIEGGTCSDTTITLSGLVDGGTYVVTAVGSAGYKKTLSATFTVKSTDPKLYKYLVQTADYIELIVWTENLAGTVDITFPYGLIPDNTRDGMETLSTPAVGATVTFSIIYEKYSSKTFRFFIDGAYDATQIKANCGTVIATDKTPAL